ncbi:hypothetical protein Gdia_2500 [Gluconacetobacter diazotrophicus PA1 5]|uniref:hypothetical protein n=1 Tax=Gluconacetobacter diazotrophicus TaxID=33996 RepID=UPI000173D9F5|nr:hypothetical protein [Gluconacetobacter diazotrophicus]ACI52244.1 hypothetical protein Gdia_2500 [Gluconacetobacter diazotrophicus PA1 5]TWB00407.1 hypothetical protein FBZ86_13721 [Gluconacetobacter diazotrophicus]
MTTDARIEAAARAHHAYTSASAWEQMPSEWRENQTRAMASALAAADAAAWRPIESAPKNRTPILAKIHDDLFPRVKPGRPDLKPWNGQVIVVHHPGILEDGFDLGWGMCAPVGNGGFPDKWFSGWRDLGGCVSPKVEG